MMKRFSSLLTLTAPLAAAVVMGLAQPAARADVFAIYDPTGVPECNDLLDNDRDGAIDLRDLSCVSAFDGSERLPGLQVPLPRPRIRFLLVRQYLRPWPPDGGCPECGLTIIDWEDLRTFPLDQILTVNPEWEVTVLPTLQQPVPGVFDDPNIPNLRIRYRGNRQIGPGDVGTVLQFNQDFRLQSSIRYVGRAWSQGSSAPGGGVPVVNVGILSPQGQ